MNHPLRERIKAAGKSLDFWFALVRDNPCTSKGILARKELLQRILEICQRLGFETSMMAEVFDAVAAANLEKDAEAVCTTLDRGFDLLSSLVDHAGQIPRKLVLTEQKAREEAGTPGFFNEWPCYAGGITHLACGEIPGPSVGRVRWKAPLGYAWYNSPLVIGGRLYCASPGINTMGYILDAGNGAILNRIERPFHENGWDPYRNNLSGASYGHPAVSCTPRLIGGEIVFHQLGAQAYRLGQKQFLFVDPEEGSVRGSFAAGELDYRIGYAAFCGDDQSLVFPDSRQRLMEEPPQISGLNRIRCMASGDGKEQWSFYIGPIETDPVMDGDAVYIGNGYGSFFALKRGKSAAEFEAIDHISDEGRVRFFVQLDGPIRSPATQFGENILVSTSGGSLYALNKTNGSIVWRCQICTPTPGAYKQFSRAVVNGSQIAIASADEGCYVLNGDTGEVVQRIALSDWGRSAPLYVGNRIIAASLDGRIRMADADTGAILWEAQPKANQILADPVLADDESTVFITYADLDLLALSVDTGKELWRRQLLDNEGIDGIRYFTDSTGSGGFFQSKPTVSAGKVLAGSPSRFLTAYDAATGTPKWRYETGAAISCAPAVGEGKVVFGQQAGEENFYCVDLETGQLEWTQALGWVWSSASIADGRVYVPGCDGYVNCLNLSDGSIRWRFRTGRAAHPEPPVHDGIVIFGSWDHYIYALDTDTGKLLWSFHTGGAPDSGAPLIAHGMVFLPAIGENYFILDLYTGRIVHRIKLKNGSYNASSAFKAPHIYLSESFRMGAIPVASRILRLNYGKGEVDWRHMGGGGLTAPVIAGDCLYTASTSDPFFRCIDISGDQPSELWKVSFEDRVDESVPAISGGMAYIVSADGHLYCIE